MRGRAELSRHKRYVLLSHLIPSISCYWMASQAHPFVFDSPLLPIMYLFMDKIRGTDRIRGGSTTFIVTG
jgi:hypothetical protein